MKINRSPRESSSDSDFQENNSQPKSTGKKPSPPKITKVLRTAADWPVWIEQVDYRLISTDCRDYISLNEAGGLELTPPKSPVRPNIGGPPDKRVRVPGDHGVLQWPFDKEYMEYVESRNEYFSFILDVQSSIDPDMGFDVTQDLTFGELVDGLKAHLGIGRPPSTAVVVRSDPEEAWESLIAQNLDGVSVEDWGEKIIEAHRSLKMSGSESVADWKAHMAFIANVNRYFPTMYPSLFTRLKRLQRKLEKTGKGRKASFRRFVRFGVDMISGVTKLPNMGGKHHGQGILEASVGQSTPGLPKRQRQEQEHGDTAPKSARKKAKKTHETRSPFLIGSTPKTPGSFSGSTSDALVPGSPVRRSQEPMMSSGLGLETQEQDHVYATSDSLSLNGRETQLAKDSTSSSSKQTRVHDRGMESPSRMNRDSPCRICSGETHITPMCGLLTIYRLYGDSFQGLNDVIKGICKVWLDNEKSTCEVTNASPEVSIPEASHHITKQDCIARTRNDDLSAAAKIPKDTTPLVVKSGGRTATAATSRTRNRPREKDDHTRGLAEGTKDRPLAPPEREISAGERAHELECYICQGRSHATDACGSLEIYRDRGSASKLRMPAVFIGRCETWIRRKKPFEETDDVECRICRDRYHAAEDCKALALYREYGDNSMIARDIRERCQVELKERRHAWFRDTAEPRDDQALDVQCNICQTNDYDTEICGFLSSYKRYGENVTMSPKIREWCRSWVQKKTDAPVSAADVSCTVCDSPHHPTKECGMLGRYKTYGDDALMTERNKERCRSWLQKEAATVAAEEILCEICRVRNHSTDDCRTLGQYRRLGESAKVPGYVKVRCRSWLQKGTPSKVVGDVPCGVCSNNPKHFARECWNLKVYRRLGKNSNLSRSMKDRCHAWVENNDVLIREGGPPPPPLCSICQKLGHTEKGCLALRTYRRQGDDTRGFADGVSERCREWLDKERREMRATLVKKEVTPRMFPGRK